MLRNMIIVYMMSRIGGKPIHKKGNSVCAIRSKSQEMGGGVFKHGSYFSLETCIYSGSLEKDY